MTDDSPKRSRGRPRVHVTPEAVAAAKTAKVATATAHNAARRRTHVVKTIALAPATAAKADQLIVKRGLRGYAALVTALVDEASARDT